VNPLYPAVAGLASFRCEYCQAREDRRSHSNGSRNGVTSADEPAPAHRRTPSVDAAAPLSVARVTADSRTLKFTTHGFEDE
jgi:hypothetical protein